MRARGEGGYFCVEGCPGRDVGLAEEGLRGAAAVGTGGVDVGVAGLVKRRRRLDGIIRNVMVLVVSRAHVTEDDILYLMKDIQKLLRLLDSGELGLSVSFIIGNWETAQNHLRCRG